MPASNSVRAAKQTAYRILVASSVENLRRGEGDLWDSGRVQSDRPFAIPYAGKPLMHSTRYWWKTQIWDNHGNASKWSDTAFWDTGLLSRRAWEATWISASKELFSKGAPCFSHPFEIEPGWSHVRAYICSLGYHCLYINGNKADDRLLEPAQTDYEKRSLYSAYDISALVRKGQNGVGVILGKGWYDQDRVWGGMSYGVPALLIRIEVEYPDGHRRALVSDAQWKVAAGPVTSNNIYAGENYDARKELPGWSQAGSPSDGASGDWRPVEVLNVEPTSRLFCSPLPPIRATATLKPISIKEIPNTEVTKKEVTNKETATGILVYDMGQNFAGWARIQLRAPAGTRVQLRFAEALDPKTGRIDTASTGVFATGVEQIDSYTCRGTGLETWEPRFTYHGFRYVEVTGLPTGVRPVSLLGIVLHTDVRPVGDFVCSDSMINRIHRAAVWTLISNLHGHPTDCPARERCGWLGDAHGCAEMAGLNFDMSTLWTKYVGDIETGWVDTLPCNVAPGRRITGRSGNPDWGVAVALLPWYRYLYYGDPIQLSRDYPLMARFVRALAIQAKGGIISNGYGDWCPPGSVTPVVTPVPLTSTAWFIYTARVTAAAAGALGKANEAAEFNEIATKSTSAFQKAFFRTKPNGFGSQTGNAMALALGLAPAGTEPVVAEALNQDLFDHKYHHDTGIFGSRFLFDELAQYGYSETAWQVLHQTDYPSIGHLFALGATTFWECWGEPELDKKWGARSLNHPMQAAYDAWFYEGLAGIRCDPAGPGFKKVIIRPQIPQQLEWVRAYHESPYGRISVAWKKSATAFDLDVTIPPNTTATLYMPGRTDSARSNPDDQRTKFPSGARVKNGNKITVQSGTYHLTSEL